MRISIKLFGIGVFSFLMFTMYALFAQYYFDQREKTAEIIINTLRNDISELSYLLSKHIRKEPVWTSRAILDRKVSKNHYISAIAVFDDQKMLVTTDPAFTQVLTSIDLTSDTHSSAYHILTKYKGLEDKIHFYERTKLKQYSLIFLIDKELIDMTFAQAKQEFFLLFFVLPVFILFILAFIIHKTVINPLERLRQYAYYQSIIPKKFFIQEIEYIRASMVQTFHRLEQEKTDLYNLARTDSLSGLANRNLLQERVEQVIELSKRSGKEFALLFLDLDHFKSVNDSLGHDIGDELLKSIAHAIQNILRLNDIVARIGGDEFVIVLTSYSDNQELVQIVNRIQDCLKKPWQIQTFPVQITSSVGITVYPKDGENLLTLMKNADIAMYQAKESGRDKYSFFTQELNEKTQEYIALTNSMREGLEKNEYLLYFQPQNDTLTGEIIGAEALIRWHVPNKGLVPPNVFIPIAEQNGFIIELGKWILEESFRQKKEWENKGMDIKLAINIAAKQIQQDSFVDDLRRLLYVYDVNPAQIVLEITEYVFLDESDVLHKTFTAIKELGIHISLDDFGTGYSSLSFLKTFPIDILKIDKSFLNDYATIDGAIFIETIIKMAQTLQIKVVAEGVEEMEQVSYLKALLCDFYQGYICSKPLEITDFDTFYHEHNAALTQE